MQMSFGFASKYDEVQGVNRGGRQLKIKKSDLAKQLCESKGMPYWELDLSKHTKNMKGTFIFALNSVKGVC